MEPGGPEITKSSTRAAPAVRAPPPPEKPLSQFVSTRQNAEIAPGEPAPWPLYVLVLLLLETELDVSRENGAFQVTEEELRSTVQFGAALAIPTDPASIGSATTTLRIHFLAGDTGGSSERAMGCGATP
jgi:hypothetical protein